MTAQPIAQHNDTQSAYHLVFTRLEQLGCEPVTFGPNQFHAQCPVAHNDVSLLLGTRRNPRGGLDAGVLLQCHGVPECSQGDVLVALGLAPAACDTVILGVASQRRPVTTLQQPNGPVGLQRAAGQRHSIPPPDASVDPADDRDCGAELDEAPPGRPVIGSTGWRYDVDESGGTVWKARRGKQVTWELVLDWAPYVSERLVVLGEDGKSAGRYYTITIGADTLTKSLADLRTADGWNDFSDDSGAASRATREVLINIITDQGKRLPRIPVVTHTGWHRLPDAGLTYVYADGRTYPPERLVRLVGAPEDLRRAAQPLSGTVTDDECREAVQEIASHGWAPMMALAVGARSLAQTFRPVSATFVFDAEPNSGKTSAANTARSLLLTPRPHAWPPVPTKGMNSTITDIECALDFEGDMPVLLDDIPLTRASSTAAVRDMERKLELVIRAAGNATELKGRRNRDLTAKPGNRVRSIPVIAAQMLPPSLQESLYRRSVVAYLSREGGEVDWRWYKNGGGQMLSAPLRALGDKIIVHLHAQHDANAYLEQLEVEAAQRFAPYIDRVLPERSDSMEGVTTAAAAMLSGLGLVSAVSGLLMSDLIAVVGEPLASSLARQAARMEEQSTAQGDVATAVGEVLRKALFDKRAHVRDAKGGIQPTVPGQVEQDQGLTYKGDRKGWDGRGPALYWLPERGPALGVTTKNLNMLLKASGDPRVNTYVDRSLPEALLHADAIYRNQSQKDRVASHRVRIGSENLRLLLIKPELVWDL